MSVFQYALVGRGHSGRGVRVRMLDGDERDAAMAHAAKEAGPDATNIEWQALAIRACICRMVDEVTSDGGFKTQDEVHAAKWQKITERDLNSPGKLSLLALFTAKDLDLLARVYKQHHETTMKEAEDIMGKGLEVSTD